MPTTTVAPAIDRRVRITSYDGLRALSLVAAMLTHAGVNRGGWIGVDTFFVLSGFLIASLLLEDAQRPRALRAFVQRRFRRLIPTVVVIVMVVSAVMMLGWVTVRGPADRPYLEGFWSILYVGNWWEIHSGSNYWAQFGQSPFGHLWSLAIEEQFYLFFPLIMVGIRRWRPGRRLALVGGLGLASAVWALWLGTHGADTSRIYYGTDTRAFGLLCGATAAVAVSRPGVRAALDRHHRAVVTAGVVALAALIAGTLSIDGASAPVYHGLLQLSSVLETVVVVSIALGNPVTGRLLQWRPLVWMGERSYSLYLWHLPVYAFLPDAVRSPWLTVAVGTPIAVVLAAVTHALIEVPFQRAPVRGGNEPGRRARRGRRQVPRSPMPVVAVSLVICVLGLGFAVRRAQAPHAVLSARSGPDVLDGTHLAAAMSNGADLGSVSLQAAPPVHKLMVVGDSVAVTFVNTVRIDGISINDNALIGCGSLDMDQLWLGGEWKDRSPTCRYWRDTLWARRLGDADTTLWMWGAWDLADAKVGGRVLRIGTPEYRTWMLAQLQSAADTLTVGGRRLFITSANCTKDGDITETFRRAQTQNVILREFADSHPLVSYLPLVDFLCSNDTMLTINGQDPRPGDGVHFSAAASTFVWQWLLPYLRGTEDPKKAAATPAPG